MIKSRTRTLLLFPTAIAITALSGFSTSTSAVTVTEFDSVTTEQQDQWLVAQTLLLENWYNANGHEDIGACMGTLRARSHASVNGDDSQGFGLYDLIDDEISKARNINPNDHVENIINGVVQRECGKTDN